MALRSYAGDVRLRVCGFVALALGSITLAAEISSVGRDCPVRVPTLKSSTAGGTASVTFHSAYPGSVAIWWVSFDGTEKASGTISEAHPFITTTGIGHAFRVYAFPQNDLLFEHVVKAATEEITIQDCGGVASRYSDIQASRPSDLLSARIVDGSCQGPSKQWSCLYAPTEWPNELYGFQPGQIPRGKSVYQTKDTGYTRHRDQIARYTEGPGFLIVRQPEALHRKLLSFLQEERLAEKILPHSKIGGDYMNDDFVHLEKADLDKDWEFRLQALEHILPILEKWSNRTLMHTDTFGIRLYKRGSVLLDHIDRQLTHVVSAVLQVDQDCDEGWPLTVESEEGKKYEIYLQPGDMALYEGSRIFHGRSKVSQCNFMANMFSHFRPAHYHVEKKDEL